MEAYRGLAKNECPIIEKGFRKERVQATSDLNVREREVLNIVSPNAEAALERI